MSKYIRVENCTAFIFTDNIFLAIDLRLLRKLFCPVFCRIGHFFRNGRSTLPHFIFWKFLWGGLHQGIHAPWWTISLYLQNFTFRSIYYEGSNIFLSFLEVFQLLKRRHLLTNYRFWPDLRIWDGLRIGSSIEYLITYIFTNIKVDHFLNFDMLREAFSSRFFRLDLVLWKKWVFFSPPDKDLASLVFRPFLKGSLNRYARILKWSLSIDYCIE